MSAALLTLRDASHAFGSHPLFEHAELAIHPGDRLCLVGRNGCGKSTLMKVLAGLLDADEGQRIVKPGSRVAYLPQRPDLSAYATINDYVLGGLSEEERAEGYRADSVCKALGIDPQRSTEGLSGGEGRRAALARTLVGRPDVLLLDEPTNHLDLPTIEWLERTLSGFRGGLVLISHDRAFLNHLTQGTLWLERGVLRRRDVGFKRFEQWSEEVLEQERADRAKFNKRIAEEIQWSREGISARRTRNQGRLRRLKAMRAERAAQRKEVGRARLGAMTGEISGKIVFEAQGLSKGYGGRTLFSGVDLSIMRGDKIGIIGPNGAGKTTLLRILTGEIEADSGNVRRGTKLTPTYLDQRRDTLDPEKTVWQALADAGSDHVMVHGKPKHVISYLRQYLFEDRDAHRPIKHLSGGELCRLLLAKGLAEPTNLLVLDEPTNDLDMDTLDLLQEVLADYEGTLLLVSHDRDFLDRVVTGTLAVEGDGTVMEYAGGYTDYLSQRKSIGGDVSAAPAKAKKKERTKGPQKKLSYKQQKALESLPGEMEALEAEISTLEAKLADGSYYTRDPDGFQSSTARLEAAQGELEEKEMAWLELEELRESLQG
ncbi:MAG: ABC-F family ATP-binding cassette domain-containing protein [Bradymonadia bacterium]